MSDKSNSQQAQATNRSNPSASQAGELRDDLRGSNTQLNDNEHQLRVEHNQQDRNEGDSRESSKKSP